MDKLSSYGMSAQTDCTAREPEVVAAASYLAREIGEIEWMLGDLLKRLELVSNQQLKAGDGEPVPGYSSPLASEIGQQASRIGTIRQRLRYQLDALELP